MKLTYSRRYRRKASPSRESAMFKKEGPQEQPFFSAASPQSFFKPNTPILRKCDKCEAEDKNVKRMGEKKEEEKPVMKMDEKKEEDKSIQKMDEKKEEKPVMKMDEKKEEDKSIQKVDDKKEEKPVMKMDEKKEEDKSISKKEEEKKLDKKEAGESSQAEGTNSYIHSLDSKGSSLPDESRQFFRQRMGYDFSDVKIHTDTAAEKSAKNLHAKAYAVDNHIVFNKGQYNPGSPEGKKLLAHELTHVAQQKGKGSQVVKSADDAEVHKKEAGGQAVTSSGRATNSRNKKAFGCAGVSVEGHTEANYTDSFSSSGSAKPSTKCTDCGEPDCVTATGTVKSVFKANPVITLPDVPDGLSECETKAVSKFINTTLKKHEQQHAAAFNTYNATVKTPYKFTGCQGNLDAYIQSIHDGLNAKRTAAANAKSDKLDPFNPTIPCKCD